MRRGKGEEGEGGNVVCMCRTCTNSFGGRFWACCSEGELRPVKNVSQTILHSNNTFPKRDTVWKLACRRKYCLKPLLSFVIVRMLEMYNYRLFR